MLTPLGHHIIKDIDLSLIIELHFQRSISHHLQELAIDNSRHYWYLTWCPLVYQ